MSGVLYAATLATALGCGLVAGVFFAFSGFVMKALARLHPAQGVAAMQAINVAAVGFTFMAALFGTAVACVALAGWALLAWDEPFAPYLLAGGPAHHRAASRLSVQRRVPDHNDLRRHPMSRTPIEAASHKALLPPDLGAAVRALTMAGATLTTGLIAGVFYAYACSVNLGLAAQPDASYVAAMQAINREIQNPVFFLSFFGAVLALLSALAAHSPRPRWGRFWLVALASALYIGGGFLLTVFVNVPLNEQLAGVTANASPSELGSARAEYEGPWGFWNGVRAMFSFLAFLALVGACLLREDRRTLRGA